MAGSISVRDLSVRRGDFLLSDVSLEIAPNEIFAVLGKTGSGKTVLFETIAGAFSPLSGSVLIDGVDVGSVPAGERSLGIVYQDYALFPHLTVFENVAYGLRRSKVSKHEIVERVEEMLDLFGISHLSRKHPGIISGGEAQRTALARALVMRPEILLLDEPFSALDPTTKSQLYESVRDIHRLFDCTIVFVTHDFEEARTLAERVGILMDGRLRAVAPACELFARTFDPDVMGFLGRRPSNVSASAYPNKQEVRNVSKNRHGQADE